jgi:hypothetical protein
VADTSETNTGTHHPQCRRRSGRASRIGGTSVSLAQINNLGTTPITITTPKGEITLTGFTAGSTVGGIPTTGTLAYSYTLSHDQTTPGANESTDVHRPGDHRRGRQQAPAAP